MGLFGWLAIWGGLSYWLAKRKNFNIWGWVLLGVIFGPLALIVLAIKKTDYMPSSDLSITDQAHEGIRNAQYFIENIASKIRNKSQ